MKALLMSIVVFGIIGSNAFAAEHNYQCISDSMQAINSDIWYNLSKGEIDEMLTKDVTGHDTAVQVAARCDAKLITAKQYECIANSLQAYNSEMYCDLQKEDIDLMLNNNVIGHLATQKAAVRCGVNVQE